MSETKQTPREQKQVSESQAEQVAPYDILFITRAYNRKEISFEEWLRLTKAWAEGIIRERGKA